MGELLHEEMGPEDDGGKGHDELQDHPSELGRLDGAVEVERAALTLEITLALHGLPHVEAVSDEEERRDDVPEEPDIEYPAEDGDRVGHEEIGQVAPHDHLVIAHRELALLREGEDDYRDAADEDGESRKHEGSAEDGADADLLAGLFGAKEYRDERDHGLGESRAHRGQHAAHRAFAQIELATEPLDPVDEQLAAGEYHNEGDDKEEDGHPRDSSRGVLKRASRARRSD